MRLPDYWISRPSFCLDEEARKSAEDTLNAIRGKSPCPAIDYALPFPKWQFLCHLADHCDVVLHGSGNSAITEFEPRQPMDLTEFGSQKAVYAAADGLWAMYFAIVDRDRHAMTLANACIRITDDTGAVSGPHYVFSISRAVLLQKPWRTGTVYLLPRAGFRLQEPMAAGSVTVQTAQLVCLEPVSPIATLAVTPEDFPLLTKIRGHDDDRLTEYAAAMQSGGPWPEPTI